MSMMRAGRTNRKFSIGTRLWPPARIFASSPYSASVASTSSMVVGAEYSKAPGFTCEFARLRILTTAARSTAPDHTKRLETSLFDDFGMAGRCSDVAGPLSVSDSPKRDAKIV